MTGQLLSVAQVAEYVGLSLDAVRRAVRQGDLLASKLGGRIRIAPSDMQAWIDHNRITPQPRERPRSVPAASEHLPTTDPGWFAEWANGLKKAA